MRKTIILLLTTLFFNYTFSQNCDTDNWNWWSNNSQDNWTFVSADQGTVDWMGSIWTGPSRNLLSINRILMSEDYTPRNGWVLIYKDFGCSGGLNNPYFILYNKYRGKLRLFMLLYNQNFGNGGIATIRWANGNKTTALLTHGPGISRANLNYHKETPISTDVFTSTTDKISNSFYSDKWFAADFDVAFDHLTPTTASDYQLSIDVSAIENSYVKMSGNLEWITEPYSPNVSSTDIKTGTQEGKPFKDYLTDARKITKNIPSESDLKKIFGDQKNTLLDYQVNTSASLGNTKISERYQFIMEQLEEGDDFTNFLTGISRYAPVVGKYLDVAIGVFDFFSSKPNAGPQQVVVMPTITHGTISLTGTIRTEKGVEPIVIGLPGTNQTNDAYKTYYNCPLGVVGLEKEPQLSIRKWREPRKYYSSLKTRDANSWYVLGTRTTYDNYKSIKIDDDLKIAINAKADVEVVDIKAALCGKIRHRASDSKPAYWFTTSFTDNDFYSLSINGGSNQKLPNLDKYKWTAYLNDNFYQLTSMDKDGFAEFSTPFIDIQNFKGTSFTVREETDVYLKIFVTLKAKDAEVESTPIVFSAKYSLSEPLTEIDNIDKPFPFTVAQIRYLDIQNNSSNITMLTSSNISSGTYKNWSISNDGATLIDAKNGNVALNAYNEVILNPGFSATPAGSYSINISSEDELNIIQNNFTDLSSMVTYYFEDCNTAVNKVAKIENDYNYIGLIKEAQDLRLKEFNPIVFPNPTNGLVNVSKLNGDINSLTNIEVFDSMGKRILLTNTSLDMYTIDLQEQKEGLYIVKVSQSQKQKIFKVIKK